VTLSFAVFEAAIRVKSSIW